MMHITLHIQLRSMRSAIKPISKTSLHVYKK